MTKKRDHVPKLQGAPLRRAVKALSRLPIDRRAKAALQRSLIEAASPEDTNARHPGRHGRQIRATQAQLEARFRRWTARARVAAEASDLDDEAWMERIEKLFEDADDEA